jgi:CRP/FNR family transcriptional regulator, cyclic AMP receptor protein
VLRRLSELADIFPTDQDQPLIALTQEQIAEMAGASRATVNQALREEEKRGTIKLLRGRTRIVDIEAVRRRAR